MIINRELSAEITSCTDSGQLYDIVVSAQDNTFILKLAAQSPHIDLRCAVFLSAYLNDLVLNPALIIIAESFPSQVQKIFKLEVDKVSKLKIPEDSPWWDYLFRHPSNRVRQATASNLILPNKFRDVTVLDVPSKIGLTLNRSISAEHCRILSNDPEAQVSTLARSALQRFAENEALVKNKRVLTKDGQTNLSKLSVRSKLAKKDQEFHPAALVGSIVRTDLWCQRTVLKKTGVVGMGFNQSQVKV